MKALVRKQ